MRFGRLFVFCAVFCGMTAGANAQFTTKSNSGFTSKERTPAAAPAAPKASSYTHKNATAPAARPAAPAASPEKKNAAATNSFTTQTRPSEASAAKPAAAPAKPMFRPRPQEPEAAEEDDELPSFDALEGKSAQTANPDLPPPPPPKGEIWFYISDFTYSDTTGMTMNCDWKVVVQNRTDTPIQKIKVSYSLLDSVSHVPIERVQPNGSLVKNRAAYTAKCPAMSRVKPKVVVKKCAFGPLKTPEECQKYFVVK